MFKEEDIKQYKMIACTISMIGFCPEFLTFRSMRDAEEPKDAYNPLL